MTIVANYFNYFLSCQHLHEPPITKNGFLLNDNNLTTWKQLIKYLKNLFLFDLEWLISQKKFLQCQ